MILKVGSRIGGRRQRPAVARFTRPDSPRRMREARGCGGLTGNIERPPYPLGLGPDKEEYPCRWFSDAWERACGVAIFSWQGWDWDGLGRAGRAQWSRDEGRTRCAEARDDRELSRTFKGYRCSRLACHLTGSKSLFLRANSADRSPGDIGPPLFVNLFSPPVSSFENGGRVGEEVGKVAYSPCPEEIDWPMRIRNTISGGQLSKWQRETLTRALSQRRLERRP